MCLKKCKLEFIFYWQWRFLIKLIIRSVVKITWLAKMSDTWVRSVGSFRMCWIICSIGVMPAMKQSITTCLIQLQIQHIKRGSTDREPNQRNIQKELNDAIHHVPVPPAIMPTFVNFRIAGGDFLSGRMPNIPWRQIQHNACFEQILFVVVLIYGLSFQNYSYGNI